MTCRWLYWTSTCDMNINNAVVLSHFTDSTTVWRFYVAQRLLLCPSLNPFYFDVMCKIEVASLKCWRTLTFFTAYHIISIIYHVYCVVNVCCRRKYSALSQTVSRRQTEATSFRIVQLYLLVPQLDPYTPPWRLPGFTWPGLLSIDVATYWRKIGSQRLASIPPHHVTIIQHVMQYENINTNGLKLSDSEILNCCYWYGNHQLYIIIIINTSTKPRRPWCRPTLSLTDGSRHGRVLDWGNAGCRWLIDTGSTSANSGNQHQQQLTTTRQQTIVFFAADRVVSAENISTQCLPKTSHFLIDWIRFSSTTDLTFLTGSN